MKNQILKLLKQFDTLPFIFVGSGLSIRYLGLENWEGLLRKYASIASNQEFGYELYYQRAQKIGYKEGVMPKVSELIEDDFNEKWFSDDLFRESREIFKDQISKNISPLKLEIGMHMLNKSSNFKDEMTTEIEAFKKIGKKSVAGFITTNYDNLLENLFPSFKTYIGQEELLFSTIQSISEVYKIHGCCTKPESIIINEKDYIDFSDKNAYIAAKLLTIFIEHPVIFLGYSISDKNIEKILKSIVHCLTQEQLQKLKQRMIFIEWNNDSSEDEIAVYSKAFEGEKSIDMTRIRLKDYTTLYEALISNKSKYNVSMLRRLKEDLYELVLTNKPTGKIKTIGLEDDDNLEKVEVVVGVGVYSEFGQRGYLGISADELYRDIVLDNGDYEPERIVLDALPNLLPRNSNTLPMYKYLNNFEGELPDKIAQNLKCSFDDLLSNTIKKNRLTSPERHSTINDLCKKYSYEKSLQLIPYLKEENIDVNELHEFLKELFNRFPDILDRDNSSIRSDVKRVIRIFDWLKY